MPRATLLITGLTAVLLVGCGGDGTDTTAAEPAATTQAPTRFEAAGETCGLEEHVRDGGTSIILDGEGDEDEDGLSIGDQVCPLVYLEAPDHVIEHMDNTRALDGMQEDTWDGIEARWTYHPDQGMNLTLVDLELTE